MTTIKTTEQFRIDLLAALTKDIPDMLWAPGELQVDILDAVAEFHHTREKMVDLFTSMKTLVGFKRLIEDSVYREEISTILNLSLTSRSSSTVFIGVPSTVSNDFDAFIYYYLDRFAERYGRKRGRGSAASGIFSISYTPGISGDVKIIFTYTGLSYTASLSLDGSGLYEGPLYSFGYGTKFNTKAGNLVLSKVISTVLTVDQVFNLTTSDITSGTDYQTNESFVLDLDDSLSIFSGPLSLNAVSKVISDQSTVDKFLIADASSGPRFLGSANIFLKGGVLSQKTAVVTVGSDLKALVPIQPSELLSIKKAGAIVPTTEYVVAYPSSDTEYYQSIRQLVWVTFAGALVFAGDLVELTLMVDTSVQDVFTSLVSHYAQNNETARDIVVYQAQPWNVDCFCKITTYRDYDYAVVKSLILTALSQAINALQIEEELQADDLRLAIREILYKNELLVDDILTLTIGLPGDTLGIINLSLARGLYWVLSTLDVEVA